MISYDKLFALLQSRGYHKYTLRQLAGISAPTIAKLSKGETVNTAVIDRICAALDCQPGDIMEYRKNARAEIMTYTE